MSISGDDLVSGFLDDQARVNSAVDDGDMANLVADFASVTSETVGMQAETVTGTGTNPPNTYGDGHSTFGFISWG